MLAVFLVLPFLLLDNLVGWKGFTAPNTRSTVQWNESAEQLAEQAGVEQVKEYPADSRIPIIQSSYSEEVKWNPGPRPLSSPTGVSFALLAVVGLVLVGGLVFVILMLSNAKTRPVAIALIVAAPILLMLVAVKFYLIFSDFGGVPSIVNLPATIDSPQSPIPLPPAYSIPQAPSVNLSQPLPVVSSPNSKQLIEAYESVINDFSQTLAHPLRLDKKEFLSDKVSTLRISIRDLGQVTVSGSPFLINSIGQALAKAMTEKMKENNPLENITPENNSKVASVASNPAPPLAVQTASVNNALKTETATKTLPLKSTSAKNTETPIVHTLKPAASANTDSSETLKAASESNRPDWVGKPPHRVGDGYEMCVSTGPYTTRLECEAKIPDLLQSATDQYVESYLGRQWVGWVQLPPEKLLQLVAAEWEETNQYSVGMMTQVYLLLNFDQKAKELINDALNRNIFTRRAAVAGTGFIGIWLLLAAVWGYLKVDLATKGAYRKRLRAAAGFAILLVVIMSMLVLRSLA